MLASKSMSWVREQKVCIVVLQCVQFLSGWVCGWKGSHAVCVTMFWGCCAVLQSLKFVSLWVKRKPCCMCRSVLSLLYCVAVSLKIGEFVGEKETMLYVSQWKRNHVVCVPVKKKPCCMCPSEKETMLYVSQCVEFVVLCCSLWNWVRKRKPCCMWHSVSSLLYCCSAKWARFLTVKWAILYLSQHVKFVVPCCSAKWVSLRL